MKVTQINKRNFKFIFIFMFLFFFLVIFCCNNIVDTDSINQINKANYKLSNASNEESHNKITSSNNGLKLHKGVCHKGLQQWDRQWLTEEMKLFLKVYDKRLGENLQGTPMMHQFGVWCIVRHVRPTHIIESGVMQGLGTWILRQAAPDAQLIMLDPDRKLDLLYKDTKNDTIYFTGKQFKDFGSLRYWADVKIDFSRTLAFIDDHNTPFKRIPQAQRVGIKHFIFEDNYWLGYSDCLSLKQGCACLMGESECSIFRYKDNFAKTNRTLLKSDLKLVKQVFNTIKTYQEVPMLWNAYAKGTTMFPERSRNYIFKRKDGEALLKELGLTRLPPAIEMNGVYTYCNIAYVELL